MAVFVTENFAAGIDTRKHPLTAPAGTLRQLLNCHITPGGEIEKRLAFVQAFAVPGTLAKSLMRVGPIIYVVVSGTAPADQIYGDLTLRYLTATGVAGELLDWDVFDGRLYFTTIAADVVKHWYQTAVGAKTTAEVTDGKGRFVRTYQSKMYSCSGANIYFSTVGNPANWTNTAEGAGFVNASTNDAEAVDLQGLEVYYDKLAFFSSRAIQIWTMDPDPELNRQEQTIRSIGVAGRATPRQYGAGDVLFLSPSGIRSLQARDSSNAASVSDVGSSIDFDIQRKIANDTIPVLTGARTVLEDLTGRFWMMFQDEIWVLSLFPGPRVSAWSRYAPTHSGDVPFIPVEITDSAGYVCIRSADDKIYILGGQGRETYDTCTAEVETAYLDLGRPIVWKQLRAFDAALKGVWSVEASYDPDNVVWEQIAMLTKSTYNDQSVAMQGVTPCVSLRLKTSSAERAVLANLAVHYALSKDD
jgi:hypothetical protein